jgi:hypothetical protein
VALTLAAAPPVEVTTTAPRIERSRREPSISADPPQSIELINRWYNDPADFAVMSNCANTQMGVWSENSLDRTVVVAMYGQPDRPVQPKPLAAQAGPPPPVPTQENVPLDPSPGYDASDELEFGINWLPWILRGVYPRPAYPPQ